ncbi:hypothetical protein SGPA1_20888 [Streptomyces misionensis JCM 4497]
MARAQGCRGRDPAMAVEGRLDRLRRRGRAHQGGRRGRRPPGGRRGRAAVPAGAARRRLPRGPRQGPAPLGRGRLPGAGLPGLAAGLQPRREPCRRPPAPGRLPDVHAERQPGPQLRGTGAADGLARLAGRAGAHPLRQPAVLRHRLRGLHLGLRHQLRRPLPGDHRRP